MSFLTLNCISNYIPSPVAGREFEGVFVGYRDYLQDRLGGIAPCGELQKIYIPIAPDDFGGVDDLSRKKLLGRELLKALKGISAKLAGKVSSNVDELATAVEAANEDMFG